MERRTHLTLRFAALAVIAFEAFVPRGAFSASSPVGGASVTLAGQPAMAAQVCAPPAPPAILATR